MLIELQSEVEIEDYGVELPEFLSEHEEVPKAKEAGWYQNEKGKLFFYDGVIWKDEVPEYHAKLEYLGE